LTASMPPIRGFDWQTIRIEKAKKANEPPRGIKAPPRAPLPPVKNTPSAGARAGFRLARSGIATTKNIAASPVFHIGKQIKKTCKLRSICHPAKAE
jgi:hypothetical protein